MRFAFLRAASYCGPVRQSSSTAAASQADFARWAIEVLHGFEYQPPAEAVRHERHLARGRQTSC